MQLCMHGHTAHCTELKEWDFKIIKNVSSSTSHKKTPSFRLSFREFKKILPNTFIDKNLYEYQYYEYANIFF